MGENLLNGPSSLERLFDLKWLPSIPGHFYDAFTLTSELFSFLPAQRDKSCVTWLYFFPQNKKINTDETAVPQSSAFLSVLLPFFAFFIQTHRLHVSESPSGVSELKGSYAPFKGPQPHIIHCFRNCKETRIPSGVPI